MPIPRERSVVWKFRAGKRREHGMRQFSNRDASTAVGDFHSHSGPCTTGVTAAFFPPGVVSVWMESSRDQAIVLPRAGTLRGGRQPMHPSLGEVPKTTYPDPWAAGTTLSGGLSAPRVERHFVWQRRSSRGPRHVRLSVRTPADRATWFSWSRCMPFLWTGREGEPTQHCAV
jgi:hypothetical protein